MFGKPVCIVIANGYPLAISPAPTPAFSVDIGETSVAIVPVKSVAQRWRGVVEIALAAIDQIDVHPAIVVVVEERAPRSRSFRQIFLRGVAAVCFQMIPLFAAGTSSKG